MSTQKSKTHDLVPYKGKYPSVKHILNENSQKLGEVWLAELKKNEPSLFANAELRDNTKIFLADLISAVEEKKFPKVSKAEFEFLGTFLKMLKGKCLGGECSVLDITAYLINLKSAFVKFLQEYFHGKKFEMQEEFQDFVSMLDLLGFLVVQDYSQLKESELNELKKNQQKDLVREKIIGSSAAMEQVFHKIEAVLNNDVSVLIQGETGTGKELVAQAVHYQGLRREKPFVAINCAAIPENLLESELFGYEKGAFTGADQRKLGLFEIAHGGTLFLDEIGELSLNLQVKLLRVLQSRQLVRVGGHENIEIDVRLITATNKDLLQETALKKFREDLYYRIAVFPIFLPPLRERGEDILLLAEHFLALENKKGNKRITGFTQEARQALLNHHWKGNIRELENVVKRAQVICSGTQIKLTDLFFLNALPQPEKAAVIKTGTELLTLEKLEKAEIQRRLKIFEGNVSKTAASLGITRATLYKKLK